jgi:hypothetical protein
MFANRFCKFTVTGLVSCSLLLAEKMQEEQANWQILSLCRTDLAHLFVETGARKTRNALSADRTNLQKRCVTIHLWGGFSRHRSVKFHPSVKNSILRCKNRQPFD